MAFNCPNCNSLALVRDSTQETPALRKSYCQCSNVHCNTAFVVMSEAVYALCEPIHRSNFFSLPIRKPKSIAPPNYKAGDDDQLTLPI